MTADDDVEAFLQMFETTATQEGWDSDDWVQLVAPLLTGEAQRAYFALPTEVPNNYGKLKREILSRLVLSSVCAAQYFHEWEYKLRLLARAQAAELPRLARHWLLDGDPTAAQVAECIVIDRFLRALPRTHRQVVRMRNPATVAKLVEAVERTDAAQHRDAGEHARPFPRRVVQERRAPEGTLGPVARPAAPSPKDEPMPTADPASPARTWLAGCIVHRDLPQGAPEVKVKINGRPALLDSGSAVSLVQSRFLTPRGETKATFPITCVHGDTRHVPTRRVTISAFPGAWPLEVGVVKDQQVPVLIGRDWPGFNRLLAAAVQPVATKGSHRRKRLAKEARRHPALLASDSGRDGESPRSNVNLYHDLFQQVNGSGSFAQEQREEDRLKHCWTQVRVV
uniref:SCAN box domain-containing protein n=1 Tax=Cyprinus carpio TaxID=7962 RepID=A0A8C2FBQ8_CYPCA